MRLLAFHFLLAWFVIAAGCVKAEFVPTTDGATGPDDAGDIGSADSDARATSDTAGPEARPICSAPTVFGCGTLALAPCDPVCQTGDCDWCTQKCSYAYATDNRGPVPMCAATGTAKAPASCTVSFEGTARQSDDCAPGSICLAGTIGETRRYCFVLCRSAIDCPGGVACGERPLSLAGGVVDVCDPPYDPCGPDGTCCDPLADTGCGADRHCLLVTPDQGSGHSRTVCEYAYGDGRNGSSCTSARDCQTRNACVNGSCQAICDASHPCPGAGTCVPLGDEYGYCL
jgi:hypothetical protein